MPRSLRRSLKQARRWLGYWVARPAVWVIGRLPFGWASALGASLGLVAWAVAGRARRMAAANLEAAFGADLVPRARARLVRRVFVHFGRVALEALVLPRLGPEGVRRLVHAPGFAAGVGRTLAGGRGVLACTAHLGNWELLGAYAATWFPGRVVARRIYFAPYQRLVESLRARSGMQSIYQDEGPRAILRALARNEMVGILPDQDIGDVSGVWVDFFGRPAWTPKGVAQMAARSGAPLVPIYLLRERRGYRLHLHEPIALAATGDREADALENTRRWTAVLEAEVRAAPEQWPWFHPRWRTTPERLAARRARRAARRAADEGARP